MMIHEFIGKQLLLILERKGGSGELWFEFNYGKKKIGYNQFLYILFL